MQRCSLYRVHKLISIYVHCDLDLWPLTSKINRVHPLVMVNMSAKFDKEICNSVVSIVFTRSTHGQNHRLTDGTTAALLYPHRNALRGDNKLLISVFLITWSGIFPCFVHLWLAETWHFLRCTSEGVERNRHLAVHSWFKVTVRSFKTSTEC